jgi:hypothetical protein
MANQELMQKLEQLFRLYVPEHSKFQPAITALREALAAQPAPVPLTDEQIEQIWKNHVLPGFGDGQKFYSPVLYARAIEAAHGITKGNT